MDNLRVDGVYGMFVVHPRIPTLPEYHAIVDDFWDWEAEDIETLR